LAASFIADARRDTTGPKIGALPLRPRFNSACPNLPAADIPSATTAGTPITYYGDVDIGTIALRAGVPVDVDPWGWILGFYPGARP
jgi:hypothetical protein